MRCEHRANPTVNRTCSGVAAPGIISFLPGFATVSQAGYLKRYAAYSPVGST